MSKIIIETPTGEIETKVDMNLLELRRLKNLFLTAENYQRHGKNPPKELIETIRESEDNFMSPVHAAIRDLTRNKNVKFSATVLASCDFKNIRMDGIIEHIDNYKNNN